MCILFVYDVSDYDLSVLSMSVVGFQKKYGCNGGGGVETYIQSCVWKSSTL